MPFSHAAAIIAVAALAHAVEDSAAPVKVLFDASGAQCLDRSPAGYYIREQDPQRWIIFLQGGGLCVEPVDCMVRMKTDLGSSKAWPDTWNVSEAPFSNESFFSGFSQVFVPYCSGDMWLGKDTRAQLAKGNVQMSGHLILEALFQHLLENSSFSSATEIVFSGSSAGGVGVFQHADWLNQKLQESPWNPSSKPRLVALPLAGVFFPSEWPILFPEFAVGVVRPVEAFMARWCHMIEGGFLHDACVEAANANHLPVGTCFDVSQVLQHTNASLFILENQFDQLQIHDLGLCPPELCFEAARGVGGKFIQYFGQRMNATLKHVVDERPDVGIFAPSLFNHAGTLTELLAGRGSKVAGMAFREAFEAWYERSEQVHIFGAACDGSPCSTPEDSASIVI